MFVSVICLSLSQAYYMYPLFVWWTVHLNGCVGYKLAFSECDIKDFFIH